MRKEFRNSAFCLKTLIIDRITAVCRFLNERLNRLTKEKAKVTLLLFLIALSSCVARKAARETLKQEDEIVNPLEQKSRITDNELNLLRHEAASLLMIGFRGVDQLPEELVYDMKTLRIGGVILFEYDAPSKSRPRNIVSPEQVAKLIREIKQTADYPILIGVDQEGGKVNRLKKGLGFPWIPSAEYLGALNNEDSTQKYAELMTGALLQAGFNVNFAPCIDVNINPACPVIGGVQRSFSSNPDDVAKHASVFIRTMVKSRIAPVIKHFPGHGSAKSDTHAGFTDVSETWDPVELDPYRLLIKHNRRFSVMTAHVFNKRIDTIYPATLSKKVVTGLLKNSLGYKGIIFSDDMMMGAITKNYDLAASVELALNAGVDVLIFSNNIDEYDPTIANKVVDTIVNLVRTGRVSRERIHEASKKVRALAKWVN